MVQKAWIQRDTQIFAAEAFAPSAAMDLEPEVFRGRDVVWFIDNEGACSTLVRGACTEEDMSGIDECTHFLVMELSVRVGWEWIDTHANPSDGLSRRGTDDSLLGSYASDFDLPLWHGMAFDADRLEAIRARHRLYVGG